MIASLIGFAVMLVLIFAGVPLGFALMFVGLVGFAYVRADMVGQALVSWGDDGAGVQHARRQRCLGDDRSADV